MRKSEINITVELDENRVPEKIFWDATENPNEGINDTKAISLSVWDHYNKGLLGINLWTKDMPIDEMNHFAVDVVGNLAQMLGDATGNEDVIKLLNATGKQMTQILDKVDKERK
ncbi:MAG: gliding motility-associated protein GldC [Spirosomataceae bacterium]|jgi:gliding motility-associated protein GldC